MHPLPQNHELMSNMGVCWRGVGEEQGKCRRWPAPRKYKRKVIHARAIFFPHEGFCGSFIFLCGSFSLCGEHLLRMEGFFVMWGRGRVFLMGAFLGLSPLQKNLWAPMKFRRHESPNVSSSSL